MGERPADRIRRLAPRSVRGRVTAAVTIVFATAIGLSAWGLVTLVEHNLVDEQAAQTESAVLDLIAGVDIGTLEAIAADGAFLYEDELPLGPAVAVEGPGAADVFNGDAVLLDHQDDLPESDPEAALGALEDALVSDDVTFDDEFSISEFAVRTESGPATLVAASPYEEIRRSTDALRRGLAVAVPLLIALIALGAWVIAGRALRPVEAITGRVEAITATTLDGRVPDPGTDDEVGHLARTMNAMLERLEESAATQRQFVADASHELRSPVAVIRAQLEVAQQSPDEADWPAVADRVLAEDARLDAVVGDLLTLARAESVPLAATWVAVDLDDVVLTQAARDRAAPVDTSQVQPVRLQADPTGLDRLVGHLLDNATRHGDHVTVTLAAVDGEAALTIDDDGAGVPAADRERVFERFTRLDESRSRDGGGAGLGLAVVRRVAERHGGTVTVCDGPGGGARFQVRLPRAHEDEIGAAGS